MMGFDRLGGLEWVDSFSLANDAERTDHLRALGNWGRSELAKQKEIFEGVDEMVEGLHRLNLVMPASVIPLRDAHIPNPYAERVSEKPPLTRRARLILIGGAVVAVAAYAYHRRRRAAQRVSELEAVRSLLEGGDSASSLDAEEVPPQRRKSRSSSAKDRSKVMDRNKKLMARSRSAEEARDAAAADAARARADNDRLRADNDRLRAENARFASNATAGDERDAARADAAQARVESGRLRTEVNRLQAEVPRLSASADAAAVEAVDALRRDNVSLRAEIAGFEAHKWDVVRVQSERARAVAEVIVRDERLEDARGRFHALRNDRDRLAAEHTSLVAEREALRETCDALGAENEALTAAPTEADLAGLSDVTLANIAADAAALQHACLKEDARRTATAPAAGAANECVVCTERPLQVAFGCGHFCACEVCATGLSKCPICRAPVTERRRIYAS